MLEHTIYSGIDNGLEILQLLVAPAIGAVHNTGSGVLFKHQAEPAGWQVDIMMMLHACSMQPSPGRSDRDLAHRAEQGICSVGSWDSSAQYESADHAWMHCSKTAMPGGAAGRGHGSDVPAGNLPSYVSEA
jgi:hypothetical protein